MNQHCHLTVDKFFLDLGYNVVREDMWCERFIENCFSSYASACVALEKSPKGYKMVYVRSFSPETTTGLFGLKLNPTYECRFIRTH
jgi:hypothetical protein